MNEANLSEALISAICNAYGLASSLSKSHACTGGLVHRVYAFETQQGRFVCKLLNPKIISSTAQRYRVTEVIAQAFKNKVSLVCALTHDHDVLFYYENDVVMVFPYVAAKMMMGDQITPEHVKKIGHALAQIHVVNLHLPDVPTIDRCVGLTYANEGSVIAECCPDIAVLLDRSENLINKITEVNQLNDVVLENNLVISHRDLDPKNVLWDAQAHYYIIDWESAGLINKTKDTIVTAMYWCLDKNFKVDLLRLETFIQAYLENGGTIDPQEIEAGFYGLLGDWLSWLDFNLSRIRNNPLDSDEFKLGCNEAQKTLQALPLVHDQSAVVLNRFRASL